MWILRTCPHVPLPAKSHRKRSKNRKPKNSSKKRQTRKRVLENARLPRSDRVQPHKSGSTGPAMGQDLIRGRYQSTRRWLPSLFSRAKTLNRGRFISRRAHSARLKRIRETITRKPATDFYQLNTGTPSIIFQVGNREAQLYGIATGGGWKLWDFGCKNRIEAFFKFRMQILFCCEFVRTKP